MAAAVMGEALISASVEILLGRIASREFRNFFADRKLNVSLLDALKTKLSALRAVLNDAEVKQITDNAVKEWLDDLKDAVLDAEDILDEINTRSLRCKVEGDSLNVSAKVRSSLSSPFKQFYKRMNSKLETISQRLEYFVKQKDILGLQSVAGKAPYRKKSSSLVNESVVVAREDDKEKVLNMLLSDDDAAPNNIGVITILGMGGVGKTTLAQLLYNDSQAQTQFDLKAWACVSDDFDVSMVTKNLYESVTSKVYKGNNLDTLCVELKSSLKDKKFLIVLDDLWNEKLNDWDQLITLFSTGKRGSKIIVTTRQRRVAEVTRTFPIYELGLLSEENCWGILAKLALRDQTYDKYPILEEIGRQIAKKCDGLPLAAKTIGGLLSSEVDAMEWNRILNSNIWDLRHDDVLPALRLSYLHLPAHMKRCFAYCSIFPKHHCSLDRKKLILLWMAEGFLQQAQGGRAMELEGDYCFNELVSRCLIQQRQGDPEESFGMHDLIYDLARVVSGKSCCRLESNEIPKNVRHLSFSGRYYDDRKKFEGFYDLKCLRTFLPSPARGGYITRKVPYDLLPILECLRVLSLSNYRNITELPESIGNLVRLRYLDLSGTCIQRLPDSTFTLYNLQTLLLSKCRSLVKLSGRIGNLVNLRHLDVSDTNLAEMPAQINRLQNLRSLTAFVVGKHDDGLRVRELGKFPNLQGKLSILKLQNVVDPLDASVANLKNKGQIEELELEWDSNTQRSQIEKDVLDKLQPSTNLRKLNIRYYGGDSFPNWVGHTSFSNIIFLSISDCNFCASLPPFGQLSSLKELIITRMKMVQTIGQEFYCSNIGSSSFQPFPLLERLEFEEMSDWQEWLPYEGEGFNFPFPCLKHLHLSKCPKLRGNLPNHLPSSTEVSIAECHQLEAKSSDLCWNTSIELLSIVKCDSLQSLPRTIFGGNSLQRLFLYNIPSLRSFPTDGLPTSLRSLIIRGCEKLEFLSHETWHKYTSLQELKIVDSCHSLTSFPLGCFPALKVLSIQSCLSLESITQGGESAPNLINFWVSNCQNLKSLPEQIDLSALKYMTLSRLPELASLSRSCLPTNLRSLDVDYEVLSRMAKPELGSQFQRLTSLSTLSLQGYGDDDYDIVSALLNERLLPTSLVFLSLSSLGGIKLSEGNGLQHLTSLSTLSLRGYGDDDYDIVNALLKERLLPTSLVSLSLFSLGGIKLLEGNGLQHLTSLQELSIFSCPRLKSFPEDQLPPSLKVLIMDLCPLLEARYQSQKGKHWKKIAHIPVIKINSKVII